MDEGVLTFFLVLHICQRSYLHQHRVPHQPSPGPATALLLRIARRAQHGARRAHMLRHIRPALAAEQLSHIHTVHAVPAAPLYHPLLLRVHISQSVGKLQHQ